MVDWISLTCLSPPAWNRKLPRLICLIAKQPFRGTRERTLTIYCTVCEITALGIRAMPRRRVAELPRRRWLRTPPHQPSRVLPRSWVHSIPRRERSIRRREKPKSKHSRRWLTEKRWQRGRRSNRRGSRGSQSRPCRSCSSCDRTQLRSVYALLTREDNEGMAGDMTPCWEDWRKEEDSLEHERGVAKVRGERAARRVGDMTRPVACEFRTPR